VHFQITTSICRKWVRKGSRPKVKSAPGRKSAPYSGYVVPSTGQLIVTKPGWFNYETVIASLREFIAEMGQGPHLTIFLDNAPWHKKAVRLVQGEAWPEYQDIRDKVALCFLPPYSPDLNPIEQCWRITRREVTHNVYYKDIASLTESLDQYFAKYRDPNPKMASLCSFKHKD